MYNNESYPSELNKLLEQATLIAKILEGKLNDSECKTIAQLYHNTSGKTYRNVSVFNELGYIPNNYKGRSESPKNNNEYKGLYVLGEIVEDKVRPIYVGISRTIYRRLRQHGYGKRHNECTLAYLIARKDQKMKGKLINRSTIEDFDLFKAREKVQQLKVVLYPVNNDYELYFLEVALAGIFKTKWNSFRTH